MPIHCLWLWLSPAGHLYAENTEKRTTNFVDSNRRVWIFNDTYCNRTCAPSWYCSNSYRFGPQVFLICWQGQNYGHSPNLSFVCYINKTNKKMQLKLSSKDKSMAGNSFPCLHARCMKHTQKFWGETSVGVKTHDYDAWKTLRICSDWVVFNLEQKHGGVGGEWGMPP